MNDIERLVQAEIDRLTGPGFSRSRRARQMRNATIRAVATATLANEPLTGEDGVLGPNRAAGVVGENAYYGARHWHKHPLVQEVIDKVVSIYRERLMAEQEVARQEKTVWLVNKEFEAAQNLFDKAADLLALPHIVKKVRRPKKGQEGEETVILDPANGPVFNAAVSMARAASDLGRRSLGLPTDTTRSEVTGAAGGPVRTQEVGRVHGGAEHVAAVIRVLAEAGAVELRPVEPGSDAADDEVHPA